jgi:hypothetical protein
MWWHGGGGALFTYSFITTTKTANIHLAVCPVAINETVGQSINSIATSVWCTIPRPPCHKNPTGQATTIHPKPIYKTVSNTAVTEYEVFYNEVHKFFSIIRVL